MYKVFLADDDPKICDEIKRIKWDDTSFIFAGEARDGQKAFSMIQGIKPDIVIAGADMQSMNGLELAEALKHIMPWVKIILISGRADFSLAKDAIAFGVSDILVKPVGGAEMVLALNRAAERTENEKRALSGMNSTKKYLSKTEEAVRDRFFSDLALGGISAAEAMEYAKSVNMDIAARFYVIAVIEFSVEGSYNDLSNVRLLALKDIDRRPDVRHFIYSAYKIGLIVMGDNEETILENAISTVKKIKRDVEKNTRFCVNTGVGSVVSSIGLLSKSFADAEFDRRIHAPNGYGLAEMINDIGRVELPVDHKRVIIEETLKYGNKSDINSIVKEYSVPVNESGMQSIIYFCYIIMDVLVSCSKYITEIGGNPDEVLPDRKNLEKMFYSADSVESFRRFVSGILTKTFEFRDSRTDARYSGIIAKAKKYIDKNYSNPGISLHSVAYEVNISPNHFSTIFSQVTGTTFIEYLTSVRIKRAKELLIQTGMRSSEISFAVGYNDPHYFSFFFKKHVGVSPREFRSKNK